MASHNHTSAGLQAVIFKWWGDEKEDAWMFEGMF